MWPSGHSPYSHGRWKLEAGLSEARYMQCCGTTMQLGARGSPEPEKTRGSEPRERILVNNSHQMQEGVEVTLRSTQELLGRSSSAATRAGGARVQTNPQRQKRPDSHSNEVPTPSPERLCVSRGLWGMCPPPCQPQPLPFRPGSQQKTGRWAGS